jgi:hypothetical protein
LRRIATWDPDEPKTWKPWLDRYYTSSFSLCTPREYLDYCKEAFRSDLDARAQYESVVRHGSDELVDGLMMEHLFQDLAEALSVRGARNRHHFHASIFDALGSEGRRLVFKIINDLLDSRQQVSPWTRAFNGCVEKKRAIRERTGSREARSPSDAVRRL